MFDKLREMDTIVKMSIIGGITLILLVIAIVLVSCSLNDGEKRQESVSKKETTVTTKEEDEEKEKEKVYNRIMAVVKGVDVSENKLTVYEFEDESMIDLELDGTVSIKNEFGAEIALSQIELGDIIESKYDINSNKPENVTISAQTWVRKDVSDLAIDQENMTIRVGGDLYQYDEELMTVKDGVIFSLDDLHETDKVTMKGYQNKVLSITIKNGHGTIKLVNHQKYVGGIIEIERKTYEIKSDTVITVSAGVQNIIISKDKLSPVIRKLLIKENEETVIDFGEVVADNTIVNFIITEADAQLFINDELQEDYSEPITLEFGEYDIRVEKEEFTPWEGKLVASEAYMDFEIDMDKQQIMVNIATPEGFEVYIGTNLIGEIPVSTPINEGYHTITIRKDGYYTKMHNVQIENTGKAYNFTFPELIKIEEETTTAKPETTKPPETTKKPETTTAPPETNNPTDDVYE